MVTVTGDTEISMQSLAILIVSAGNTKLVFTNNAVGVVTPA